MKILYLSFDPGIPFWGSKGGSVHIREFTKTLKKAGHKVTTIVARRGEPAQKLAGLYELPPAKTHFFRAEATWGRSALLAEAKTFAQNFSLRKILKNLPNTRFDLIYERYSLFGIAGLSLARERKLPFVLEVNAPLVEESKTHRQLLLKPLAQSVEKYLFTQANHIVAVSQAVKNYIHSIAPEATVTVLPNGVDIDPFLRLRSTNGAFKKVFGQEKFRVGFVGSLKPWHGVEFLLEAFRRLPKTQNFELVIIGDGPLRYKLEKKVLASDLSDRVTFTGAIAFEKIPPTLLALNALVAPYPHLDGFYFSPLKLFEYMASGRPIVASRIGQVAEILQNGKNALLVPPENPKALAAALLQLKVNPKLSNRLGKAAQKAARQKHTWRARLEVIEPVFRSLVTKR